MLVDVVSSYKSYKCSAKLKYKQLGCGIAIYKQLRITDKSRTFIVTLVNNESIMQVSSLLEITALIAVILHIARKMVSVRVNYNYAIRFLSIEIL